MTTMTIRKRRSFAQIADDTATRPVEHVIAAIDAGHRMASMPLTADDIAALRRVDAGETTTAEELRLLLDDLTDGSATA